MIKKYKKKGILFWIAGLSGSVKPLLQKIVPIYKQKVSHSSRR